MKIALIRRHYTPHGGAERYVENLSRELAALGHEVHLFSHYWPEAAGITIHPVPMLKGVGLLKLWSFNLGVQRLLVNQSFDVVQSFEKTWCQDVYRAGEGCHREWLFQRRKYESLFKTLGVRLNPFHWLTLMMERKLFEKSRTRFFIANSQRGKREILTHYRVSPEKIQVIYSAVPFKGPFPLKDKVGPAKRKEKVLLFVGSGFQRKGLFFVINALPLVLKQADVRLLVVGQGDQKRAEALANRLGILDRVSFTGPVKEVLPFYQQADAFVLPSIYEPFSNACLEALASGLPLVTTEMNGASEDILPGQNGYVLQEPKDRETLADLLIQGLKLDQEIIKGVNQNMLIRHTWEGHLEGLLGIYRKVIEEKKVNGQKTP
jgi:UDP-glucose:(heptosyl)LPS alpha-1,3-glucosyltransferase